MRIYHDFYSHEDFNKELYSLLVYYLAHNITFIGLDRDDIYAAFRQVNIDIIICGITVLSCRINCFSGNINDVYLYIIFYIRQNIQRSVLECYLEIFTFNNRRYAGYFSSGYVIEYIIRTYISSCQVKFYIFELHIICM